MVSDVSNPSRSPPRRGLQRFSVQYQPRNGWFTDEPDLREENIQIWKSQVLVPSSTSSCVYFIVCIINFQSPLEKIESEETEKKIPHNKVELLLIFARNLDKPYNLHYLETRVFRTAPRIDKVEDYISWLDWIEARKGSFWKDLGIFDLINCRGRAPDINNIWS